MEAMWTPLPPSYRPETVPRAVTSEDGRFVIRVTPGAYRLSARAAGYIPQTYGAIHTGPEGFNEGTVLQLAPQQSLKGLTITLTKETILSGRVTNTDGQALIRIEVAALKRKFSATGSSLELQATAQTNDRGEYRIAGLSPGNYIVSASGLNPLRVAYETFAAQRSNSAAPLMPSSGAYGPVYYPTADKSAGASDVEVRQGAETRNIDFVLPKHTVYTIRGRVLGVGQAGIPGMSIRPAYAEYTTGLVSAGNVYKPDGTFELAGVGPGYHWVIANVPVTLTPEQRTLLATQGADLSQVPLPSRGVALVHVVDSDVSNVEITMVTGIEVQGSIIAEGAPFNFSARSKEFKLELRPTDPVGNGVPRGFSSLDSQGRFVVTRLLPTEYRLTISEVPAPFYVKEARYGSTELLRNPVLLLTPSSTPLNIVLARGSVVSGLLIDNTAQQTSGQKIILVPEGLPQRYDLYKTAVTNRTGAFAIDGVAPGNYMAFSWDRLEEFQYFDPLFISRFQDKGTPVRVDENAKVEVRVNVIHR